VALIVGVLTSIGFWIIGLPFWLVIGAIAGLTNLIPLVGPFIGGGLGLIVGVVSEGVGLGLQAGVVALVVQQIDNHIISPNVMKRTVQLHPVTVMLSILAGGALAGFWGVLLGVPTVAVVKLLMSHFWTTRVLGTSASPYASSRAEPPSVVPEKGDTHVESQAGVEDRSTPGKPVVPDKAS
jgi:predicted PurR-regulated permease PerM